MAPTPRSTSPDQLSGLDPSELDVELVARLRIVIARVGRQLRQQTIGLSPTLQSMLGTIAIHGPLSLSELAAREQVAPPTVTKVLAKLDDQGLVARHRDPDDRRVTKVTLTEAGHQRFEESRTLRTAWLVQRLAALDDIDEERLEATVELLEAILGPDGRAVTAAPGDDGEPSS